MADKGRSGSSDDEGLAIGEGSAANDSAGRAGEGGVTQAEILKSARKEFGWTQAQAAAEVGVALRTWQFWESDRDDAREAPEMLYRLLELQRELRRLTGEAFSWAKFNEELAKRGGNMLLRPAKTIYGFRPE